jgi:hypothetical protein
MIEPILCAKCGRKGYPGEGGFPFSSQGPILTIKCDCGQNTFNIPYNRDQHILSTHTFVRLGAASNHIQSGKVEIHVGKIVSIKFDEPFDSIGAVYLTPESSVSIFVKEVFISLEEMAILSSLAGNYDMPTSAFKLHWTVYGLNKIASLPNWWLHFYTAIGNAVKRLWKPALLDYAVAFEIFVETHLFQLLVKNYGGKMADFLLKKTWRIDDRVKDLLELTTGHRLSENNDIYIPWHDYVKEPRNKLSHGEMIPVGESEVEKAHQAVYQAIRWIENLPYPTIIP